MEETVPTEATDGDSNWNSQFVKNVRGGCEDSVPEHFQIMNPMLHWHKFQIQMVCWLTATQSQLTNYLGLSSFPCPLTPTPFQNSTYWHHVKMLGKRKSRIMSKSATYMEILQECSYGTLGLEISFLWFLLAPSLPALSTALIIS